jgi:hypothetical protein
MRITNADVIKSGEKDLIDSITADLDWGAIEEIFLTEHNLGIDEDIEYKSGDIIAYNNQVAYKLEFSVKVNLSVLINRDGEYLSVKICDKKDHRHAEDLSANKDPATAEDMALKGVTEWEDKQPDCEKNNNIVGNPENTNISIETAAMGDRYIEAIEQIASTASEENGKGI